MTLLIVGVVVVLLYSVLGGNGTKVETHIFEETFVPVKQDIIPGNDSVLDVSGLYEPPGSEAISSGGAPPPTGTDSVFSGGSEVKNANSSYEQNF